jgi:hypothetical protein
VDRGHDLERFVAVGDVVDYVQRAKPSNERL